MGFEFSDSIKRGGASCCEVVYMGCEFEIILKDDTQYFQSVYSDYCVSQIFSDTGLLPEPLSQPYRLLLLLVIICHY